MRNTDKKIHFDRLSQYQRWIVSCTVVLIFLLSSCVFSPKPFNEQQWRKEVMAARPADLYAEHQRDGVFFNPWLQRKDFGFLHFLRWRFSAKAEFPKEAENFFPVLQPELDDRIRALPVEDDFLVWLGHATFLIRIDGVFWLTDPMLSKRALLPARYLPPALTKAQLSALPGPMNVIISHNHYDHLDTSSLKALPADAHVFVPLGLKNSLLRCMTVRSASWTGGRL